MVLNHLVGVGIHQIGAGYDAGGGDGRKPNAGR